MKVLIVEDDELKRLTLVEDITEAGYDVTSASSGESALEHLQQHAFDLVITDLKMPGMDGIELLRTIREERNPGTEVIMMTAFGTIPLAVEAIRLGALDFITKPFDNRQLLPLLASVERRMARKIPESGSGSDSIFSAINSAVIGTSPPMRHLKHLVKLCAEIDSNVLLCGETGTGKDLAASTIHRMSRRGKHPFVKVSCAMYPDQLVESELFGHVRGAFTGADQRRTGRIDLAEGGTVYLDDVDDIPLREQVKLLRVIEEKVFESVGSTEPQKCDVRFIASTKAELPGLIDKGLFREDLYYRLKVIEINMPALRQHPEDIPQIAVHILKRISGSQANALPSEVLERLMAYGWPGNVRELSHSLEQALIISGGQLKPEHFPQPDVLAESQEDYLRSAVGRTEREIINRALMFYPGNKTAAARSIGMKTSTFRDKLRKHGLE